MAISRWLAPILLMVLLNACATPPPPLPQRAPDNLLPAWLINTAPAANPTPAAVRADPSARAGQTVLWGGHIVAAENTPPWTRVEIDALPLNAEGRPDPDAVGQGRFFVELATSFDPGIYATGRPLTVSGPIRIDAVGPVIRADEYYLWDTVDVPLPPALTRRPPPPPPICYRCAWPRPFGVYSFGRGFGGGLRWPYGFGVGYGRGWGRGWGASIGF